jgi:hypothetical protein
MRLSDDELLIYILIDEHPGLNYNVLYGVVEDKHTLTDILHSLARKNLIYADQYFRYYKKAVTI